MANGEMNKAERLKSETEEVMKKIRKGVVASVLAGSSRPRAAKWARSEENSGGMDK